MAHRELEEAAKRVYEHDDDDADEPEEGVGEGKSHVASWRDMGGDYDRIVIPDVITNEQIR